MGFLRRFQTTVGQKHPNHVSEQAKSGLRRCRWVALCRDHSDPPLLACKKPETHCSMHNSLDRSTCEKVSAEKSGSVVCPQGFCPHGEIPAGRHGDSRQNRW